MAKYGVVSGFTRFEYIGPGGRLITLYGQFTASIQDQGRTLKVFGDQPLPQPPHTGESAGEVKVKPLVFNRVGAEWHCYSNIGLYLVSPMGGGGYGVWFPVSDPEGEPDLIEDFDGPAQTAAQADYETRIRSALAE